MSREIKFRVWFNNRMWYGIPLIRFCESGVRLIELNDDDSDFSGFPDTWTGKDDYELMQFTGLHDRNGKKLYHFDLIVNQSRNNGNPHIIDWSNKYGAWVGKYNETEYLLAQEQNEINYCGNRFEHPELLDKIENQTENAKST